jgi:acyl-coenzyme A synthetase/AMP-(fatty) acid ligase/pimeloyl-ACP methyl ester carboxylesterase
MVEVRSGGGTVTWSILDTGLTQSGGASQTDAGTDIAGTIVCVHGNPTWGYLWRDVLQELGGRWRVIAVDQTGMGWSERTGERRLAQRVEELVAFCEAETDGPIVLIAHDWGGPVAMGAAARLDVRAVVLTNTAVAKPDDVRVPPLIAIARSAVGVTCEKTPLFVRGTARMTAKAHRDALNAPYTGGARRTAVAGFVEDIPVRPSDVSAPDLQDAAAAFGALEGRRVPVLLLWGGRDPVFHDRFLADLIRRAPHADVHRFPEAGHLVALDEPIGEVIDEWLRRNLGPAADHNPGRSVPRSSADPDFSSILSALGTRRSDTTAAYVGPDATRTWKEIADRSVAIAEQLVAGGVLPGDRVAMLVPPGADLLETSFAVWRAGAVLVVADSALGPFGLRRALRAATVDHILGTRRTVTAARVGGFAPGARAFTIGRLPGATQLLPSRPGSPVDLPELRPTDLAAVVHTSGATGAAKPVRYTHGALAAQRDAVRDAFELDSEHGFISSFAPFILLGPALGVPCVLPDGDILKPAELDFDTCAEACRRSGVDVAWFSPASARTIARTAAGRTLPLRLVMLAGAPISAELAQQLSVITGADVRAPYGMTEVMPVTDGRGASVSRPVGTDTGSPLPGTRVVIVPFDDPNGTLQTDGSWGEILVHAPWMRQRYDRRWGIDRDAVISRDGLAFHRTGDVGFLDDDGHLIQLGRTQHVITTASGPVPCITIEQPLVAALGREVAAVGIGPRGAQVIAVVVAGDDPLRLADQTTTIEVRSISSSSIAAVLEGALPVDIRHQSKVRRDVLGIEAARLLEGR